MEAQNAFETHVSILMNLIREKCPNEQNTKLLIGKGLRPLAEMDIISIEPSTAGNRSLHTACGLKIAVSSDHSGTVIAFFSALPSLLTGLIEEWTTDAIATTLSFFCGVFIEIFSKMVIIENKTEWEILEYISFFQKREIFPTVTDISRALNCEPETIQTYLELLQKGKKSPLGRSISLVSSIFINGNQCFKVEV